jgi:hypothetical protein
MSIHRLRAEELCVPNVVHVLCADRGVPQGGEGRGRARLPGASPRV